MAQNKKLFIIFCFVILIQGIYSTKRDKWDTCYAQLDKERQITALLFQGDNKNQIEDAYATIQKCLKDDGSQKGTIKQGTVFTDECKTYQAFTDRSDEKVWEWRKARQDCFSSCMKQEYILIPSISLIFSQESCDGHLLDNQKDYDNYLCFGQCKQQLIFNLNSTKKFKPLDEVNDYMEQCYKTNQNSDCSSFNNDIQFWGNESFLENKKKCDNICIKEQQFEYSYAQVQKYKCEQQCVSQNGKSIDWLSLIPETAKSLWNLDEKFNSKPIDLDLGDLNIGQIDTQDKLNITLNTTLLLFNMIILFITISLTI